MTTWKKEIDELLKLNGETWDDVESHTMTDDELNHEFDDGYGGSKGCCFTLWTKTSVYFPVVYDGSEWVGCVSRNPDGIPTCHIGGE